MKSMQPRSARQRLTESIFKISDSEEILWRYVDPEIDGVQGLHWDDVATSRFLTKSDTRPRRR